MSGATDELGEFELDPNQLDDIGELAEAFIDEELDADLLEGVDREELEALVEQATTDGEIDVESDVYEAAIEVAELIVERMDAVDE
jgi:glycerol-3-phosphate responsive antiterminator